MVAIIFVALYVTGGTGGLLNGDSMKSILWGIARTAFPAMIMYKTHGLFRIREMINLIFEGCIFGDHLSPISGTTGCDVMDHVRSQMPYGLLFGIISFFLFLAAGFGG